MVETVNWTERFGISGEESARIAAECGDQNPLKWCLLNGRIPEPEYLQWAMQTFQIPSVSPDFFLAPPDQVFWDRVKKLHGWRADFFPLAEWEGVLLIACVEPPKDFHFRYPHRIVLASARSLLLLWNSLNPELVAAEPARVQEPPAKRVKKLERIEEPTPDPEAAFGASADDNFEGISEVGNAFNPKKHAPAPEAVAAQEAEPELELPDGFAIAGVVSSRPNDDLLPTLEEVPPAPPAFEPGLSADDLPNGLVEASVVNISFDFGDDVFSDTPAIKEAAPKAAAAPTPKNQSYEPDQGGMVELELESDLDETPLAPARAPVEAPVQAPVAPAPQPVPRARAAVTPPPPPAPKQATVSAMPPVSPTAPPPAGTATRAAASDEKTVPLAERQEEPVDSRGTAASVTVSNIDIRTLDTCRNLDDLGAVAMVHTLRIFNGAMVLLYQGGELKPWKWSDLLTSEKNKTLKKVDLETPSIFKIVFKTRLPYHGYVATSPTNVTFFNAFHAGTFPAHVTLVPIVVDEEFTGMIMGVSNVEISYKESLKQMERLSEDFANRLARLRSANAA